MKNFIFSKDGQFSVYGGVLVAGDIEAYRIGVDMGRDTSAMTAIAVCQENGEYNGDYEAVGNRIFVTLASSMYSTPGFINIRLAVSEGDSVITTKEIRFRVAPPNNSETLANDERGTISDILTAVSQAKTAAQNAVTMFESCALQENTYTKSEIDSRISSVFRYKGTVEEYEDLPSNPNIGDVYNVRTALNTKAYAMNVSRVVNKRTSITTQAGTSFRDYCYLYVDEPSDFTVGKGVVMYGDDGNRIGGFSVQEVASNYIYENKAHTKGLSKICDFLYYKHNSTNTSYYDVSINKKYYFTGLPEASDSIDVTIVNAGDNVVWNGHEWDNLGGSVDLSMVATTAETANMINTAIGEVLGGES